MPVLTFTFDTGPVPLSRVLNAFAGAFKYQDTIQDPAFPADPTKRLPNPESKADFSRRMVRQYIIDIVRSQDMDSARKAAEDSVNPINIT